MDAKRAAARVIINKTYEVLSGENVTTSSGGTPVSIIFSIILLIIKLI